MSTTTEWMLLTIAIQWIVPFLAPERHMKGKILTLPLQKRFRFYRGIWGRLKQILSLLGLVLTIQFFVGSDLILIYFAGVAALYIDDYLTGGDDRWKKRWESVKNKIKWKMELPQPVPVRETA